MRSPWFTGISCFLSEIYLFIILGGEGIMRRLVSRGGGWIVVVWSFLLSNLLFHSNGVCIGTRTDLKSHCRYLWAIVLGLSYFFYGRRASLGRCLVPNNKVAFVGSDSWLHSVAIKRIVHERGWHIQGSRLTWVHGKKLLLGLLYGLGSCKTWPSCIDASNLRNVRFLANPPWVSIID